MACEFPAQDDLAGTRGLGTGCKTGSREERKRNMADDKSQRGGADRRTVAGGEDYEVDYFARKHGLTVEQAQNLIDRFGNDRTALEAEAEKLSKE